MRSWLYTVQITGKITKLVPDTFFKHFEIHSTHKHYLLTVLGQGCDSYLDLHLVYVTGNSKYAK